MSIDHPAQESTESFASINDVKPGSEVIVSIPGNINISTGKQQVWVKLSDIIRVKDEEKAG